MSQQSYHKRRRALLSACAWNRYVATRGLNAAAGRDRLKENQAELVQLRREDRHE